MCLEDRGRGPQTEATSQPLEARKDRGVSESETESHSVMSTLCDPMDYTVHGILQCWGPAPADPGYSKERRHRRGSGNNCLIKR